MSRNGRSKQRVPGSLRLQLDDGVTVLVTDAVVLEAIAEAACEAVEGESSELDLSDYIVHEPATLTEAMARGRFDPVQL